MLPNLPEIPRSSIWQNEVESGRVEFVLQNLDFAEVNDPSAPKFHVPFISLLGQHNRGEKSKS